MLTLLSVRCSAVSSKNQPQTRAPLSQVRSSEHDS
jgi:hypothetical protein